MARPPSRFPRPVKRIQQRQLELRARLWPGLDPAVLWHRHTHDGFTTVPSTMPLIMSIMDDMSKGSPVSSTYLDLWTRAYDECFVTLAKPREMAFHAGFSTQRAERTWRQKLDVLAKFGFIDLKSGPSGPASYALILNPYLVIKDHHDQKTPGLREDKYNALVARALEIGDKTFAPPAPPPPAIPELPAGSVAPFPFGWAPTPVTVPAAGGPQPLAEPAAGLLTAEVRKQSTEA
jgi:hypothetical protein